jgi:hypothetical protein
LQPTNPPLSEFQEQKTAEMTESLSFVDEWLLDDDLQEFINDEVSVNSLWITTITWAEH